MFVLSYSVYPWQASPIYSNVCMYESKATAILSEAFLRCSTLGKTQRDTDRENIETKNTKKT